METHSISAGLDYSGVGPEHASLKDSGRAEYIVASDEEALRGFRVRHSHYIKSFVANQHCLDVDRV